MKKAFFDALPYLSIPYVYGGRKCDGADCFGLLHLIYKNELGIILPDYPAATKSYQEAAKENIALSHIHEQFELVTSEIKAFDVLLLRQHYNSPPGHVGIAIDASTFVHCLGGVGTSTAKIRRWKSRTVGIYRHKELIE
jgi:cell wall-associated NlpC family hydrolase